MSFNNCVNFVKTHVYIERRGCNVVAVWRHLLKLKQRRTFRHPRRYHQDKPDQAGVGQLNWHFGRLKKKKEPGYGTRNRDAVTWDRNYIESIKAAPCQALAPVAAFLTTILESLAVYTVLNRKDKSCSLATPVAVVVDVFRGRTTGKPVWCRDGETGFSVDAAKFLSCVKSESVLGNWRMSSLISIWSPSVKMYEKNQLLRG